MYGEGRPRLDLEYPVYGAHELANEGVLPPWLSSPPVFLLGFAEAGI